MKKSLSFILLFLILCLCCCTGTAERKTVVKDKYYLGAMRVVKCKDYVSLREAPYKTATVLAKVPLDSIVLYCNNNVAKYAPSNYKKQAKLFIRCEYDGMEGYILKQYLKPAPEAEPAETKAFNSIMSREEIIGNVNANMKTIRYELGTRIRNQVRVIPELRFFIDDSLDYIDRIDELLKK